MTWPNVGPDPARRGDDHRCYFADPSGGFGWPSCVICGAPVNVEEHGALRACCRTRENTGHDPGCRSMDAMRRAREAAS